MNYQETIDYLFSRTTSYENQGATGYKEGLDTSYKLDEHFGHPHESFRSIHVAGTNGKGSVAHLIAAELQVSGYKVGLYTSPHLIDFRERIRINGTPIDEDYVVKFVEEEKEFFEPLNPSFFELTTAMAFKYFKEKNVDIAVIEVGLGGRLDCTNIITPIVSIITNISLDHTQLLGSSLEQIAFEKGGIIKKNVPVIIGEAKPETRAVFSALASEMQAPIYFAEDEQEIVSSELKGEYIHYKAAHLGEFDCELTGEYQPRNMNTVVVAMHRLVEMGYLADCIDEKNNHLIAEEMSNAFKNVTKITGLMARWQTVRENPRVICDTGHNPGAWEYLGKQLESLNCQKLRIIFGIVEDKDIYGVMALLPKNATYFFTKGSTKRAFPETSLKIFGEQFGLKGECYPTVIEAYQAAMQGATSEDVIFIGGSTYIVADFLKTRI
ncbi:folylpolyglutamate synthase/dihydrofolate synthase family protein [uncultured Prevotella sp.]|uniref:bifunctional folylpolyglutamate synthase/dihydrofolate synthase n=1 Tax=uncultured Prevotella sp. TaxID=159272 RepID=UPI0025DC4B24|nr:folylpolyglutamate synthase/dihydrofolate synthase family protein [uncultured Prevotella sp.]